MLMVSLSAAIAGLGQSVPMLVNANGIPGIEVTAYSDSNFTEALAALAGGSDLSSAAEILPYAVILRNTGSRRILAVLRRYEITRNNRLAKVMNLRTEALANPEQGLAPG